MKLYELKRGQKFKMQNVDGEFIFDKVDGMYARIFDKGNQLRFIACYVEVEVIAND